MPQTADDADFKRCKFSITCHTDDLAVVHCLRALCHFAEIAVKPQIAWGGTTIESWASSGKQVTLRFTSPHHRETFIREATRLLPAGIWKETARSDDDPAHRQRPRRA
ncbi:MAG: hypothetical protein QM813_27650 [Verrucomicrobiota bacterium]